MSGKYDDIIMLEHHVSEKRAPMSRLDRAAQFSPFAALTGYEAAIEETARLTESAVDWDEGGQILLDEKIRMIKHHESARPKVILTFFQPDGRKEGGAYVTITAYVKKVDEYAHAFILTDGTAVSFERIYDVELGEEKGLSH